MTNIKHPSGMTKDTLLSVLFSLGIGFITAVILSLFVLLVSSQSYAEEAAAKKSGAKSTASMSTQARFGSAYGSGSAY